MCHYIKSPTKLLKRNDNNLTIYDVFFVERLLYSPKSPKCCFLVSDDQWTSRNITRGEGVYDTLFLVQITYISIKWHNFLSFIGGCGCSIKVLLLVIFSKP